MVASALVNSRLNAGMASPYRELIDGRPVVVSFATVTELRFGALKAGWGELRTRGLDRDLASFGIVQPDDELMRACARLRASCEQAGHPLGQKIHEADRWIAVTALSRRLDLVSDDQVFQATPGLSLLTSRD
jgi:predicted nucleic acid-binding protein